MLDRTDEGLAPESPDAPHAANAISVLNAIVAKGNLTHTREAFDISRIAITVAYGGSQGCTMRPADWHHLFRVGGCCRRRLGVVAEKRTRERLVINDKHSFARPGFGQRLDDQVARWFPGARATSWNPCIVTSPAHPAHSAPLPARVWPENRRHRVRLNRHRVDW